MKRFSFNSNFFAITDLSFRPITINDTEQVIEWRNNPNVMKNFIYRKPLTFDDHLKWFNNKIKTGEVIQYIIEVIKDSSLIPIGSVYFRDIDYSNSSAEFGIFIGEDDARGKGYGRQACKMFTGFGHKELKLHRISLRLLKHNEIVYKTYEKSGYIKEYEENSRIW